MKAYEYLAAGRPILASDLPVIREILHKEWAVLLPPDDGQAWREAIRGLQADPARRREPGGGRAPAGRGTLVAGAGRRGRWLGLEVGA